MFRMSAVQTYTKIFAGIVSIFWLAVLSAAAGEKLPEIGPAPEFKLIDQDGNQLALKELRGKVVVVTFIYTSCTDTCPLLTAKMAGLQSRLGAAFGPQVFFISISVDPEHDTPRVLKAYARARHVNTTGWAFLTGSTAEIRDTAKHYGVYYKKMSPGDVDHTFLTSLIDHKGMLRVQYMGVQFHSDEMLRDLQILLGEAKSR